MSKHTPCPTCGCTLYQETGPCVGMNLLRTLRAIAEPKEPDNLGEPASRLYLAQQIARIAIFKTEEGE